MARINIPRRLQLEVFYRDYWHCRYCLEPVFFNPTLKLLNDLSPGHGYYHAHGKTGETLTLFQWRFASADHVLPVAEGGENTGDNLVTACWRCNLRKSDGNPSEFQLQEVPADLADLHWDGLASIYPHLPGADPLWSRLIREASGV